GAMAAEALGLTGNPPDAVARARDKLATREAFDAAGLPTPGFRSLSLEDDPAIAAATVRYPCVLKPVFLSASRGVIRADSPDAFVVAFERIASLLRRPEVASLGGSRAATLVVEDFIPGPEVALEGLVSHGALRVLAIYDKPDPLDGPFFEETLLTTPSRHPAEVRDAIERAVASGVAALGLRHGPIHAEARISDEGVRLLEIAPRSIGGLCSRTLRFTGGESLEGLILRHAAGEETTAVDLEPGAAGVMMIPTPAEGTLTGVVGRERALAIRGIEDVVITIPPGHRIVGPPDGDRYLGFIFARADDPGAVEQALREAHARLRFDVARDSAP
ncbi:MAG: ATP-grasp domain-containing protein, partial [Acidobacteriota bacterium]|nr:ATP-grasp domain-containing protein [Acidobacteriota bacterium]